MYCYGAPDRGPIFLAMLPPIHPTEAEQVLPPSKQFLTEDQLDEIWDTRGMKYCIDALHLSLLSRGLLNSLDRPTFRSTVYEILKSFLVSGASRIDPRKSPRPRFPKVF